MPRIALLVASAALVAGFSNFTWAAGVATNHLNIPVAPNGGNKSIEQWGGIDDKFAVSPDGDETPNRQAHKTSPLASNQDGVDDNDPGDPDPDRNLEILPI